VLWHGRLFSPETQAEDTLSQAAKLEASEERPFKQKWLDMENVFFAAVEVNAEPNPARLMQCAKNENKGGDGQSAGSERILRLISWETKKI